MLPPLHTPLTFQAKSPPTSKNTTNWVGKTRPDIFYLQEQRTRNRFLDRRPPSELEQVRRQMEAAERSILQGIQSILTRLPKQKLLLQQLEQGYNTLQTHPETLGYRLAGERKWKNLFALVRDTETPGQFWLEYQSLKRDKAISRIQFPLIIRKADIEGAPLLIQVPYAEDTAWPADRILCLPSQERTSNSTSQFISLTLPNKPATISLSSPSSANSALGKILDVGLNQPGQTLTTTVQLVQELYLALD